MIMFKLTCAAAMVQAALCFPLINLTVTLDENNTAKFACVWTQSTYLNQFNVTWYKDKNITVTTCAMIKNFLCTTNTKWENRVELLPKDYSIEMILKSLSANDEGLYTCQLTSKFPVLSIESMSFLNITDSSSHLDSSTPDNTQTTLETSKGESATQTSILESEDIKTTVGHKEEGTS
ncbi:hypothetical protein Bpfe_016779, partial [Biomphalaria pfeifferi]